MTAGTPNQKALTYIHICTSSATNNCFCFACKKYWDAATALTDFKTHLRDVHGWTDAG